MPIPVGALISTLGPIILGGLLSSRKSEDQLRDPQEMLAQFMEQWAAFFQPGKAAAISTAATAGRASGQQLQSSLGGSGALSSGTGRVSSAVGGTLGTLNAGMAEQQFLNQTARAANQSFASSIGGGALNKPNSERENQLAFLADLLSNKEVMAQLMGLPGKFKGKDERPTPFGAPGGTGVS